MLKLDLTFSTAAEVPQLPSCSTKTYKQKHVILPSRKIILNSRVQTFQEIKTTADITNV